MLKKIQKIKIITNFFPVDFIKVETNLWDLIRFSVNPVHEQRNDHRSLYFSFFFHFSFSSWKKKKTKTWSHLFIYLSIHSFMMLKS